jgi:malonyl-CoA O-methyltransferase
VKERIRRRFDKAGATYQDAALVQRAVALELAANVRPGTALRILEIGCGSGFLHPLLRERGVCGPYLALDLSRSMLGCLADTGDPVLYRVQADGEDCPLRPGSIDLLLSSSTLQWFERPATSIPNLLALLRPGGRFALALFVRGTLAELAEACRATGFGSVLPLRPASFYTELLAGLPGISYTASERQETLSLDSVQSVLKHLRDTGVGHTAHKRPFSRSTYGSFLEYYQSRFGTPGRVPATYRILFLYGTMS